MVIRTGGSIKIVLPSGKVRVPDRGAEIIRFFKSGARYYVRAAEEKNGFGWSTMEPENAWRKTKKAVVEKTQEADTSLPEMYRKRVEEKIADANGSYKAFFDHFSMRTGDRKSAPFWRCENSGGGMRCEISGEWKKGDRLSQSTQALAQELENVLLGSDFGVIYNDGVMEIQRRKNTD